MDFFSDERVLPDDYPVYGDYFYLADGRARENNMARFAETSCSQCGRSFGPGDSGFSHCIDHPPYASSVKPDDDHIDDCEDYGCAREASVMEKILIALHLLRLAVQEGDSRQMILFRTDELIALAATKPRAEP